MNQPASRYTGTAIALHWVMALAILGNFCLGLYMTDLGMSMLRLKLYNYHKWTGATILALAALDAHAQQGQPFLEERRFDGKARHRETAARLLAREHPR